MRYVQNTIVVLAVTILTAGAIYTGVSAFAGTELGTTVASSSGTLTCPATGCTASSCHGASGGAAPTGQGSSRGDAHYRGANNAPSYY